MHSLVRRFRVSIVLLLVVAIFGGLIAVNLTRGATYTWDGGGADNNWSTCANWTSDTCPGSADIAHFDSSTTTDSVVDSSFAGSVSGVDIDSGYTGTITQERNLAIDSSGYTQDDGTWRQGTTTFDINDGGLSLTGGIFLTGEGNSNIERGLSITGGTFTASSSEHVTFDGTNSSDNSTITCSGDLPFTFGVSKSNGAGVTLSSDCAATSTSVSIDGPVVNNGTWHIGGTLNIDDHDYTNHGTTTATSTATLQFEKNFNQHGIFDANGATVLFNGTNDSDNSTLNCTGQFSNTINISKSNSAAFTLGAGCEATTSSSVSTDGNITNDGILHLGTSLNITDASFTNNGTTTMPSGTIEVEWNFNQHGFFDMSNITVDFDGTNDSDNGTIDGCNGIFEATINVSKDNGATFTMPGGCEGTTTDPFSNESHIVNDGILHFGNSVDINDGNYTNGGTTTMLSGGSFTIERNVTQNGVFDMNGGTMLFDGDSGTDDSTISCAGDFGVTVDIVKAHSFTSFTLASGCSIVIAQSTAGGPVTVNGTLSTQGNTLTTDGNTLSVGSTGVLRLHGDETLTTPTLNSGSTVDYYGSGTYSSLIAGTDYEHLQFTGGGTYNIGNDVTVAGDFTSTDGSTFNQTSGTFTLDGSGAQTITGTSTFNQLTKSVAETSTLYFGANQEQTVSDTLTLQGDSDNTLYVKSTATGTQSQIDMQSLRTLEYLTISDTNNTNDETAFCDPGCVNDGNNTNITFSASPDGDKVYWDGGGGDNNWSTCANWKLDTCPDSTTVAAFDDRDTSNSTLDASFAGDVSGLSIESGYTGTITSNRSLTVDSGGFTLQDGSFTAPASTLTIYGDFTHSGGTFTPGSGAVQFASSSVLSSTAGTAFNDITVGLGSDPDAATQYTFNDADLDWDTNTVTDDSGNGNDGTLVNLAPTSVIAGQLGEALAFESASSQYVDLGSYTSEQTTYTIAFWIKTSESSEGTILHRGTSNHCFYNPRINVGGSGTSVSFTESGCSGSGSIGSVTVTPGTWEHIAIVRSGENVEVYHNATLAVTDTSQPSPNSTGSGKSSIAVVFGHSSGYGTHLTGALDNVQYYDSALTSEDITKIYTPRAALTLSGDGLDLSGDLSIPSKAALLDASISNCSGGSCDIEVGGDWTNNGTFEARSGTVTFDGTSQTLSGDTTFNNFTKSVTSADTIAFGAGETFTIKDTFTFKGVSGNLLTATSTGQAQWKLNANTYNSTVEYVDVSNSNSISDISAMYCYPGCIDGGTNTNWLFEERPIPRQRWRIDGDVRIQGDVRYGQ